MKLEDMPTPEHDALFGNCNDRSLGDELCMIYILAHSLEQRLAFAVAALKEFDPYRVGYGNSLSHDALNAAWRSSKEALSQIEKGT